MWPKPSITGDQGNINHDPMRYHFTHTELQKAKVFLQLISNGSEKNARKIIIHIPTETKRKQISGHNKENEFCEVEWMTVLEIHGVCMTWYIINEG